MMKLVAFFCMLCVSTGCQERNASASDMNIAQMTQQTGRVSDVTVDGIAAKINEHLASTGATLQQCDAFEVEQLHDLLRTLHCHFSPELHEVYKARVDDKRALRFDTLEAYEQSWKLESAAHGADKTAMRALKDAKCAEVLMMWTHHVNGASKDELKELYKLPRLPTYDAKHASNPKVGQAYTDSFTCVTGHNMTAASTSDHKFPHWPEEVHYTGMGHGAYPFWLGPDGRLGKGAPIEVWWSEKQHAEKFYHSTCAMTEAGAKANDPCYHLFVGAQPNPTAYLYTKDESFCCISGSTTSDDDEGGAVERLAPPQSNFMDTMVVDENWGNVTGTYYNGPAKRYLLTLPSTEAVTYFWYITTMDDLPVQQGEGGNGGAGIEVYHEYNTSSFKATTIDPSVFAVPAICKTTTTKCGFP
jgi:hypothetical protein